MREIDPHMPINDTAREVVSKSNEHGQVFARSCHISSMTPLPIKSFPGHPKDDLSGMKRGKLTVIGMYPTRNSKNKTRWVVKCICGRYEVKTGKSLRKVQLNYFEPALDMCHVCARELHYRKRHEDLAKEILTCSVCGGKYENKDNPCCTESRKSIDHERRCDRG